MGYSYEPWMCRVDFFKPSGKWNESVAVSFEGLYSQSGSEAKKHGVITIHDCFRIALKKAIGDRHIGQTAVCLEPYHEHSHPLMIKWEGLPCLNHG